MVLYAVQPEILGLFLSLLLLFSIQNAIFKTKKVKEQVFENGFGMRVYNRNLWSVFC